MSKFRKGQSGNPVGRPLGSKDKRTALRALLEPYAEDLVKVAVTRALDGDVTALRLCLERLMPPLRAKDEKVIVDGLKHAKTMSEQGLVILGAIENGDITPTEASTLMGTISAQAKILEIDELERRVTELEIRRAIS